MRLVPFVLSMSLFAITAAPVLAQEGGARLPARFDALTKNARLKLSRVLGGPEIHPAFNPTTAFTGDGKRAVYVEDLTTGAEEKPNFRSRVYVWDVHSKSWPREFDLGSKSVSALSLSASGDKILLSGQFMPDKAKTPRTYLTLWDLAKEKEVWQTSFEEGPVLSIAMSPDENLALTGGMEDVKVWDLKAGKAIQTLTDKNKTSAVAVAWLPGAKQFLAGYQGGEVRLYARGQDKPVETYVSKAHRVVWHLAVSADGKRFASGDFTSAITLWEIGGKALNTLTIEKRTVEEVITSLALAPDGKTVLSTWGKSNPEPDDFACARLIAWDGVANKTLWSEIVPQRGRIAMHVKGNDLLFGGGPNQFQTWTWNDGRRQQTWGGHKGPVTAVGVLPNGDVFSAGQEGTLLTWRKGEIAEAEKAHQGAITALAISRDGKDWLTAGADRTIRVWPPMASRKLTWPKAHAAPITSLAFGTGNYAYSGSGDRTVKSWHLEIGQELASFAGHSEGVNAVAVSPDDRWLASGSDDTTIKVWPIKDGKLDPDRDTITLEKHTKAVTCLMFTPDGKKLLSASQDQKLMVWDWQKGRMDFMIPGHKNWINSILLMDAKTLLTSSDDLTIAAWDLATGMEIGRIDLGVVGDCPRCLAKVGPDRFVVGTSSWLIYEFQILPEGKTKTRKGTSDK